MKPIDLPRSSVTELSGYPTAPQVRPLSEILPDDPLLMMGAGPVPIPDAVARANSVVINHLGSTMSTIIGQVKEMARYVFQTRSDWVLGVAGPGSAAMEMAICNLVQPATRVLCVRNGFFSGRMGEMARRIGAEVIDFDVPANSDASAADVERLLDQHRPQCLTIVQGETSNTVFNRELPAIAKAAKARGCLVIVDAVCTLSTMPLEMDAWQIDAVITGHANMTMTMADVKEYADYNRAFVEHVRAAKKSGQTVEQAITWKVPERFLKNGYMQPMPDALRSNAQVVWNELK